MRSKLSFLILILTVSLSVSAQNRRLDFESFDINSRNEIITTVRIPSLSGDAYTSLLRGRADTLTLEALTMYPERSFYFPGPNELMIHNHLGCYLYDSDNGTWQEMDFMPSLSTGQPVSPLALQFLEMSPDGRFAAYIREDQEDRASLILYDRVMKVSLTVTSRLNREYQEKIVKWSPDSRYFIYRRGRELYYFSIEQYLSGRIPAESFRNTGFLDIQSVQWGKGNYLYILKDRHLYRIHSSEFFTRSFYSEPFRKGTVRGRLPVPFNPVFDRYITDSSGGNLILIKNEEHLMVLSLDTDTETGTAQTPTLHLGIHDELLDTLWLDKGILLVLVKNRTSGTSSLYRYGEAGHFILQDQGRFTALSASPDGSRYALLKEDGVSVHNSSDSTLVQSFSQDRPLQFHWGKDNYYSAGRSTTRIYTPAISDGTIISLSQSSGAGFNPGGELISEIGNRQFKYNEALSWISVEDPQEIRPARNTNSNYRVYLEPLRSSWYSSSLKIRNMEGLYTSDLLPLFNKPSGIDSPAPRSSRTASNPWYFDRGHSTDSKEVTLVINAVDSAQGTRGLLNILERYKLPASFFLNGDFIHANPRETKMIADSGHTVGSLFHTWFDLSSREYQIDKTFLKKGIARNEDDYFIATGKEMAMLWHTPGYYLNADILETSASMQYVFIGTDIPVQDRISRVNGSRYDAVKEMETLLARVRPGSIITLTLGEEEGQKEYLIQMLPTIVDELVRQGYEFVELQEMMKSSRF